MTNPDDQPEEFDGRKNRKDDGGHHLPPDIDELLRQFPGLLTRLKDDSGLSWSGLARAVGVDRKRLRLWGRDTEPMGGSLLALFHFADGMPGGIDTLLGRPPEPGVADDGEEDEGDDEEQEDGET